MFFPHFPFISCLGSLGRGGVVEAHADCLLAGVIVVGGLFCPAVLVKPTKLVVMKRGDFILFSSPHPEAHTCLGCVPLFIDVTGRPAGHSSHLA
jgi:hypothetical protein